MSTLPDSPGERHLFSKVVRRREAETEICLTCPGQQQWDNSSCVRWAPLYLSIWDYNFNWQTWTRQAIQSNYSLVSSLLILIETPQLANWSLRLEIFSVLRQTGGCLWVQWGLGVAWHDWLRPAMSGSSRPQHSHLLPHWQPLPGHPGHQRSHPPPAGRLLDAPADGVLTPAILQLGRPGQGEAHPAARPQGGGGLRLPSPGQHVSNQI